MTNYNIITKHTAFEALEIDNDDERESYYDKKIEEESEKLAVFGYSDTLTDCHLIHFFDSAFTDEYTEEMTIDDAIQCLALKEGCDLVRFENGNIGYIGYYGNNINGFEIIA